EEMDRAISILKHREVVGSVQEGLADLGRSKTPLFWSKASKEERKAMVVADMTLSRISCHAATSVSQGRNRWWNDLVLRKLAEVAESCRQEANSRPYAPVRHPIMVDLGRQPKSSSRNIAPARPDYVVKAMQNHLLGGVHCPVGGGYGVSQVHRPGRSLHGGRLENCHVSHRMECMGFIGSSTVCLLCDMGCTSAGC
ncbi:hypothetical protein GOODEAATRI_025618, partial [Goodea atripinnis]